MLRLRLVRAMVIRWREGLEKGGWVLNVGALLLGEFTWGNLKKNLHAFVLWIDWMKVE